MSFPDGTVMNESGGLRLKRLSQSIPSTYTIFKEGSDYYAETHIAGGTDYDDPSLSTLWGNIVAAGRKIVFRDGNFTVDASLTYYENMVIEGFGQTDDTGNAATRLIRDGNHVIFTPNAGTLRFVDFANLSLEGDGKGTSASALVTMGTDCSYLKFRNVTFRDGGGDGVDMDGTSWNLNMVGCRAYQLTGDLVSKVSPDIGTLVNLYGCTATHGGYLADIYGVNGVVISGCGGDNWDSGAVKLQACGGGKIEGCDFEGDATTGTPDHMIRLIGSRVSCVGNRIYKGGTGNYAPINITGDCSNAGIVMGNKLESTVGTYSMVVAADAVDWKVYDNYFDKTVSGWATGRAVFRGNSTYISESSGTGSITSGGTTDVIAHGLSFTPTAQMIVITLTENPTNTPGAVWVDTIGAANFTVNCENDPGASNLDFAWSVRMDRAEP